jgi:hypothetical protein
MKYLKLSVNIETEPEADVQDHIRKTVLGTPGRMRYQHTSFREKLPFLGRTFFLNLRKSGKLMGTIAFILRDTMQDNGGLRSWYIRYFSIRAPLRDTTFKRERARKEDRPQRDNLLKSTAETYFTNPDQIAENMEFNDPRSIIYAYVEKENLRSWNFSESVGFETVGAIHSTLFSRFRPKQHAAVRPAQRDEKDLVLEQLRAFYHGYNMYTEANLFFNDNYLVWEENGRIVAGCQANPELWHIHHIPGLFSGIFLRVLSRIPFISRRIDPKYLNFIAFEGIWYTEEFSDRLLKLVESALAFHGFYLGVLWLDSSCRVHKQMQKLGRHGMVGRFFTALPGDIRVRFINWSEKDKEEYRSRPSYISCFDMT